MKNHTAAYAAMVDAGMIAGIALARLRRLLTRTGGDTPPYLLSDAIRHSVFAKGFKVTDVKLPAPARSAQLDSK